MSQMTAERRALLRLLLELSGIWIIIERADGLVLEAQRSLTSCQSAATVLNAVRCVVLGESLCLKGRRSHALHFITDSRVHASVKARRCLLTLHLACVLRLAEATEECVLALLQLLELTHIVTVLTLGGKGQRVLAWLPWE